MNKKIVVKVTVGLILVILLAILGREIFSDSPNIDKQQVQVSAEQTQSNIAIDESVRPVYDKLWNAVDVSLKNRQGMDIKYDVESKMATIRHDASSLNSETDVVNQAWSILALWGSEATKLNEVEHINVQNQINTRDIHGNEVLGIGVIVEIAKDQFLKFDWEKLKNQNVEKSLSSVSTIYIVAPDLASEIKPNQLRLILRYP